MFVHYDDIVTIDELCEMLHIGKNVAYRLIKTGEIKSFRVGGSHKIPRHAIIEFIMKKCGNTN